MPEWDEWAEVAEELRAAGADYVITPDGHRVDADQVPVVLTSSGAVDLLRLEQVLTLYDAGYIAGCLAQARLGWPASADEEASS